MPNDHTTCENEPIHTPGTIQPFGVLLVFGANTLTLRHASKNNQDVFGHGRVDPLGSTAAELLGSAADTALRHALARDGLISKRPIPISVPGMDPNQWHGVAHCLSGLVFVELEPVDEEVASEVDVLAIIRASIERLSIAATVSDFCMTLAGEVRSLTGYDRVMVYRFDTELNGEVVAEERCAELEPYLGLHYPASDIPAQARVLFQVNRIRVIPDAVAQPNALISAPEGLTDLPLDMSRCVLRSVAAVHREYMHNMGVRASLTASLVIGDRLWGLIACHHLTPKCPGQVGREACALLAQMASAQLAVLAAFEDRNYLINLAEILGRIGVRVGDSVPPIAALVKDPADLLALVGAGGAVVWRSGRVMHIGHTPPEEAFPELIDWIKGTATPLIATDRFAQVYAPAKEFVAVASGCLALEVSRDAEEYVLWFRPEVLQTINWGGDPHGTSDLNGRLSPRRSLALWIETVRGRSLPWRPTEVANARRIKELLLDAASLSAIRLEAIIPICAWCKKVRDEPEYWRSVEEFIHKLVDVRFTHGVCPECLAKQTAEFSAHKAKHRSGS